LGLGKMGLKALGWEQNVREAPKSELRPYFFP